MQFDRKLQITLQSSCQQDDLAGAHAGSSGACEVVRQQLGAGAVCHVWQ
jgi:hypothetical protein